MEETQAKAILVNLQEQMEHKIIMLLVEVGEQEADLVMLLQMEVKV